VEVAVIKYVFKEVVRLGCTIIFDPSKITKSSGEDDIL
jgi:hypothetical protein